MQGNFAQTSTSTFHTADIIDIEQNILKNFDMPRQLFKSHFQEQFKYENRPLLKQLISNKENNKKRLNTQSTGVYQQQAQTSRRFGKQPNLYSEIAKIRQNNSTKKNLKKGIDLNSQQALTQATFKPIHLKTEIQIDQQERILKRIFKQKFAGKKTMASDNSKKKFKVVSRIFEERPPTKYQKILSQYYILKEDLKQNKKSKDTLKTIQKIGNIHYKRAVTQRSIGKEPQKQKVSVKKIEDIKIKLEKKQDNVQKVFEQKEKKQKTYKSLPKTFKTEEKEDKIVSWMSMNFHQRQQKVLENRKKKQDIGKKQKIDQQTQGCTFKPALTLRATKQQKMTRSSSVTSYSQRYKKKVNCSIGKK